VGENIIELYYLQPNPLGYDSALDLALTAATVRLAFSVRITILLPLPNNGLLGDIDKRHQFTVFPLSILFYLLVVLRSVFRLQSFVMQSFVIQSFVTVVR
jgi:hypothetical protein